MKVAPVNTPITADTIKAKYLHKIRPKLKLMIKGGNEILAI